MWKSLNAFLKIKDEFQQQRLEWILGVADACKEFKNKPYGSYGVGNIREIDERVTVYRT